MNGLSHVTHGEAEFISNLQEEEVFMSLGIFKSIHIVTRQGILDGKNSKVSAAIHGLLSRFVSEMAEHVDAGYGISPIQRSGPDEEDKHLASEHSIWLRIDALGGNIPSQMLVGESLNLSKTFDLPVQLRAGKTLPILIVPADDVTSAVGKYNEYNEKLAKDLKDKSKHHESKRPSSPKHSKPTRDPDPS
jgi:hypothetical protein